MLGSPGKRVALAVFSGVVVVVASIGARAITPAQANVSSASGPPALLEVMLFAALRAGETKDAVLMVEAANDQEPDLAWRHALALRGYIKRFDPLMHQAGTHAKELIARLPSSPRPPAHEALPPPPELASEIVYLRAPESDRAFAGVFEDLTAILGKRVSPLKGAAAAITSNRRIVVAPAATLPSLPANRLVALAPEATLESAMGLSVGGAIRMDRCVLQSSDPALALLSASALALPVEGTVRTYRPSRDARARAAAVLHCADGEYPALFRLDREAGQPAYMFTFNVLESLVRTRQGDPALKDKENDGVTGRRPSDLFARDLSAAQLQVPFSDLLMESLLQLVEGDRPTVRLWHHPAGKRGVLIITSDQDFASEDRMAVVVAALAQWKAPATLYLTSGTYQDDTGRSQVTAPSLPLIQRARELGLTVGAHTNLLRTGESLEHMVAAHQRELQQTYQQPPHSSRFHYARWEGYTEPAAVLARAGYRYDTTYITLNSRHIDGLGYMTGAGLPLPFYTEEGAALGIRQLATQIDDHVHPVLETGLRTTTGKRLTMSLDALNAITTALVQGSGRSHHSPITLNNHPLQFAEDPEWLRRLIETARVEQVDVLDVEGYAAFVSALQDSAISSTDDGRSHRVLIQAREHDLVVRHYAGKSVLVDGSPKPLREVTLFGRPAKMITLPRGAHSITLP